ncbi:MAG: hypothetical protein ACHQF0_05685 [Chitinophagales bacterium]
MKKMLIIATVLVLLFACSKSVSNMTSHTSTGTTTIDCSGPAKSFSVDVNPIIQSTCATGSNCHAAGSINGPGELTTYTEIERAGAQIRAAVLSGLMPKTGSLTTSEKTSIICWIDNGSSNN